MLSKAKLKYIKSLQLKKYRKEEQRFIVEGARSVAELLDSDFQITMLAATPAFIGQQAKSLAKKEMEILESSEQQLAAAGALQTNQSAPSLVKMKPNEPPRVPEKEVIPILGAIRGPGKP